MITAVVPTGSNAHSEEFIIHRFAGDNWRLLSDECAIYLNPVCDSIAQPINARPVFDRVEVWPVQWGYPDSLIADYPAEVERMKKAHFAGKHELIDGNLTWETWLKEFGVPILWGKHSTPGLEKAWLNNRTGPGFRLSLLAGTRTPSHHVSKADLNAIRFRADFHHGHDCSTGYLSGCAKQPLHVDEARSLPSFIAEQEKLAMQKELSRGWTNDDFSIVRLRLKPGKFEDVPIPPALRYFLQVLHLAPANTLIGSILTKRVAELREAAKSGISEKDYRPQLTVKSSAAKRLRKAGVLHWKRDVKEWVYRLQPPAV